MDEPASSILLFFFAEAANTTAHESESWNLVLLKLFGVLVLVLTNGFFVASEFSLVSVRRTRVEARAADGSSGAKSALRLLDNPTLFISAVQLGVTLASLALGWLGE